MAKFYFLLWLRWAFMLSFKTLFFATLLAAVFVLLLYLHKGIPALNDAIYAALAELFSFSFAFTWSFCLLLFLFREMRGVFLHCYGGYKLELLSCKEKSVITNIGYGDLLKVWRKWFILLIWLVASTLLITVTLRALLGFSEGFSEWFNIFWLSFYILFGGYISFILLAHRCKKVRISRCSSL